MPSADDIKDLRERTSAGILDCKEALQETDEVDEAVEYLQKKDAEMAEELSERTAAEGVVDIWTDASNSRATLVEVNCETDFAARKDEFREFVDAVVRTTGKAGVESVEELEGKELEDSDGVSIGEFREQEKSVTASLGENVSVRRVKQLATGDYIGTYVHSNDKIAAAVALEVDGANEEDVTQFGRNVAMHIAAMSPKFLSGQHAPDEVVLEKEELFAEQMREKGKPEHIIPHIVKGKIGKWKTENGLLTQEYIRSETDDFTVKDYQDATDGVKIQEFVRFEVGEGIETEDENFAEEVRNEVGDV